MFGQKLNQRNLNHLVHERGLNGINVAPTNFVSSVTSFESEVQPEQPQHHLEMFPFGREALPSSSSSSVVDHNVIPKKPVLVQNGQDSPMSLSNLFSPSMVSSNETSGVYCKNSRYSSNQQIELFSSTPCQPQPQALNTHHLNYERSRTEFNHNPNSAAEITCTTRNERFKNTNSLDDTLLACYTPSTIMRHNNPSSSLITKPKRAQSNRTPRACVECRKAHKKCDQQRPCFRCVLNGTEELCVDCDTGRRRGRKPLKNSGNSLATVHMFSTKSLSQLSSSSTTTTTTQSSSSGSNESNSNTLTALQSPVGSNYTSLEQQQFESPNGHVIPQMVTSIPLNSTVMSSQLSNQNGRFSNKSLNVMNEHSHNYHDQHDHHAEYSPNAKIINPHVPTLHDMNIFHHDGESMPQRTLMTPSWSVTNIHNTMCNNIGMDAPLSKMTDCFSPSTFVALPSFRELTENGVYVTCPQDILDN
ncbi:hypothetical protein FDP41_001594 [Naegleria fowleri]|uniref:Zn(2)-C6 fungal-type domain-containing protein n=1 Tax=Naegleria fowleri TaxID=5763 RepID=A0A6A5BXL7_NAEFO|nr:uncharacterized protein FDP41_001594 [Naegleria fowleri]KAF0979251.1 hypothetical protein FDP41_001594 [Naegleria fowleri]CAG4712980.1 unnamed protein product [Naegleria fowleri]